MAHAKIILLFLSFLLLNVNGLRSTNNKNRIKDEENNRGGEIENRVAREEEPNWMKLCPCVKPALQKMQRVVTEYTEKASKGNVKRSSKYKPPALDEVIAKIKKIAHDCTKKHSCHCPEGYFKTDDGAHCLKISNKPVSCQEAVEACESNPNARLAVAKDHVKLTALADYIRELDPTDNSFYWIGLSYNRTEGGIQQWTWEDGSAASYAITKGLKRSVKKSLDLTITNPDEAPRAIERVAISKNYKGTHWKQESCLDKEFTVKHKYICEFLMFNVNIKAVSSPKLPNKAKPVKSSGQRREY